MNPAAIQNLTVFTGNITFQSDYLTLAMTLSVVPVSVGDFGDLMTQSASRWDRPSSVGTLSANSHLCQFDGRYGVRPRPERLDDVPILFLAGHDEQSSSDASGKGMSFALLKAHAPLVGFKGDVVKWINSAIASLSQFD